MSLYLKYRPKLIDELDLTGVRQTLGEMIKGNKLAHAYLFTGPRGAGKTSAARVLARVINCEHNGEKLGEPCNDCDACLSILSGSAVDVIEIDAASNRGIDDIRELKERIRLAPTLLRKKVYIIDEVHMLTTEAFNALLKTLEEPPDHAVFILCTTESHKVPETISSRCVRVTFTKATSEEMTRSFTRVISGEKAEMAPDAVEFLSLSVDGSFRDGVKILDTVLSLGKPITRADVEKVLFGASGWKSLLLSQAILDRNAVSALELFRRAVSEGIDLLYILTSIMKDVRGAILSHVGVGEATITVDDTGATRLIVMLDDVARKLGTSPVPEYLIEMAIVEWCRPSHEASERRGGGSDTSADRQNGGLAGQRNSKTGKSTGQPVSERVSALEKDTQAADTDILTHRPTDTLTTTPSSQLAEDAQDSVVSNVSGPIGGIDAAEAWQKLITTLNGESYSLGALLSKAQPGNISGNTLTILVAHDFHREQIMHDKFRSRLEQKLGEVLGAPILVRCELATLQTRPQIATIAQVAPGDNELMDAAEEIFGN